MNQVEPELRARGQRVRALALACVACAARGASASPGAASPGAASPGAASPGAATVGAETILVDGRAPAPRTPDGPDAAARDRARALGEAPFVTIVRPEDQGPGASVADAVGATVGVRERSLGGGGAYASISVRGAAPGNTAVLLDGVPLARIAAVTTDLGRFELGAFSEVELYRGAVPVELGGAGVGGAVDMITRLGRGPRGERVRLVLGAGSFGARLARARWGDELAGGRLRAAATLGLARGAGDFTYFSDGGTPLNPADDGTLRRANNAFAQVDGAARLGATSSPTAGGVRAAWKAQGLPGSVASPTARASLSTLDVVADGRGAVAAGAGTVRPLGFLLVELQRARDPGAELGLGAPARRYLTVSGGATASYARALGAHRGQAAVEARGDRFRDEAEGGGRAAMVGDRAGAAASLAAELRLAGGAVVVAPAARLDAVRTAPTAMATGPTAGVAPPPRWDLAPSPRLTALLALGDELSLKGSAGWYVRLPTLLELFGDRGFIVGSPGLRAERGPSADLGLVWAPARPVACAPVVDRVMVEAAAFATRGRDTIALVSSAGRVARALNVGDAESLGAEVAGAARLARAVTVSVGYTHLATAQRTAEPSYAGKALPRAPRHAVRVGADASARVAGRLLGARLDASWQAASFLDRANLQAVPARALLGAGVHAELGGGLALALDVDNLADVRVERLPLAAGRGAVPAALADLAGFPLPGRSLLLSLQWLH